MKLIGLKDLLFESLADKHSLLAAIALPDGEIFTGRTHYEAMEKILDKYPKFDTSMDDLDGNMAVDGPETGWYSMKTKKFLTRNDAHRIVFGDEESDAADEFEEPELHSGDL